MIWVHLVSIVCSLVVKNYRNQLTFDYVIAKTKTVQFLPHDAYALCRLCRHKISVHPFVCLSVCSSVTTPLTTEHILKIFSRQVAPPL